MSGGAVDSVNVATVDVALSMTVIGKTVGHSSECIASGVLGKES